MIQISIFPDCNRDTGDYDVIKPENLTLCVAHVALRTKS